MEQRHVELRSLSIENNFSEEETEGDWVISHHFRFCVGMTSSLGIMLQAV